MTPPKKRVLITGSNGLLGQKIVELLSHCSSYNVLLTSRHEAPAFQDETFAYVRLDTSKRQDVRKIVDEFEPEVIVNTAAMTNVDLCETDREAAWRANVTSVENLVHAAKLAGAHVVHFSTDYIFDGKSGPYGELDRPNPVCYYGRTKLAGENVLTSSGVPHAIIRTMVLYGIGFGVKVNFALWLLRNFSEQRPMKVVDDQVGNPTLADDVAYGTLKIIELGRQGTFNIAGRDLMSRYQFAQVFAEVFGFNKKLLTAVPTSALSQAAHRPLKSGLITLKAETDLGLKPSGAEHGLRVFKNQLDRFKQGAD